MAAKATGIEPLLKAISFAAERHKPQLRKDGKTPYVAHVVRVMMIARHQFGIEDIDVLCAAVLHDTIEDTTTDYDDIAGGWGPKVAGWVALLTKNKSLPEKPRELEYFDALEAAPIEVRLCKLADTFDNLTDVAGLPPPNRHKALDKARDLLKRFSKSWPAKWKHVLDAVREKADALEASL